MNAPHLSPSDAAREYVRLYQLDSEQGTHTAPSFARDFEDGATEEEFSEYLEHVERVDFAAIHAATDMARLAERVGAMVRGVVQLQGAWLQGRGLTWPQARALNAHGRAELQTAWTQHLEESAR